MVSIKKSLISLSLIIPSNTLAVSLLEGTRDKDNAGDKIIFERLVANLATIVTNVAASVAVLMIVVGGLIYITSAGDPDKADKGKKFLSYAIMGLIIVLSAKVLLAIFAKILGGSYS